MRLDTLRAEGQGFMEEISAEYHRAHAGFKASAELQPIYARHAGLLAPDRLAELAAAFRAAAPGSGERRATRLLLEWLAELHASRAVAGLEEREIAWEAGAVIRLADDREIPYARAAIEIANQEDRRERERLDVARAALVARELAPMRRERLAREREVTEQLDLADGYVPTFELLSGIALDPLLAQCDAFLRDTQPMWDETVRREVKRVAGVPIGEATRADALAIFRGREFDDAFPGASLPEVVRGQLREMGIDPDAGGRVRVDLEERPAKRSRAFCAPVRIPDEVHLVMRPHGGQSDWTTLMHEMGHALHFAAMAPAAPFEERWLGDNSVTEGFAMLFDHRMQDRGWLGRYSGLGAARIAGFLRMAAFVELHFVRRYCGKLLYEVALYRGDASWDALPEVYAETLGRATSFRYRPADAFVDFDPRFYAARYLRAWQLQALVAETLTERFDSDWHRNPRAGPWLTSELWHAGQRETAEEMAARIATNGGGGGLSFAPVVRAVEGMLG